MGIFTRSEMRSQNCTTEKREAGTHHPTYKLAADKGVQLSTALDSKQKSKIDKLAKLSGTDFDKRYISDMVSDHKTTINAFQKEADKGKDADVKQFASKTLPTIKEHLQLAESTDKEVKESKSKSAGK